MPPTHERHASDHVVQNYVRELRDLDNFSIPSHGSKENISSCSEM